MSTEHAPESTDHRTDRHDDRTFPAEDAHPDPDRDASAGWRGEYAFLGVSRSVEPDRVAAATRQDHPERYRRKHRHGISS